MIGAKIKTLCFAMFASFLEFRAWTHPQNLRRFLISETGLKFLVWTQGKIDPGNQASPPVNTAHERNFLYKSTTEKLFPCLSSMLRAFSVILSDA